MKYKHQSTRRVSKYRLLFMILTHRFGNDLMFWLLMNVTLECTPFSNYCYYYCYNIQWIRAGYYYVSARDEVRWWIIISVYFFIFSSSSTRGFSKWFISFCILTTAGLRQGEWSWDVGGRVWGGGWNKRGRGWYLNVLILNPSVVLVHTCEAITLDRRRWRRRRRNAAEGETREQFKRKVRFPNDLYTPKIIIITEENFSAAPPSRSTRAFVSLVHHETTPERNASDATC